MSNVPCSSEIVGGSGHRPDEGVDCTLMLVYLRRRGHSGKAIAKRRGEHGGEIRVIVR